MATNNVDFSNTAAVIDIIGGKWDIEITYNENHLERGGFHYFSFL